MLQSYRWKLKIKLKSLPYILRRRWVVRMNTSYKIGRPQAVDIIFKVTKQGKRLTLSSKNIL